MEEYYHEVDALSFQHQVNSISKEMGFRLSELIDASRSEISRFYKSIHLRGQLDDEQVGLVAYRFGSVIALLQTFRDALDKAVGEDIDRKSLVEGVPHANFLFQLRNALVHDGYQAASSHSAIKRLLGDNGLSEADFSFVSEPLPVPLDLSVGRLREITKMCADRLEELEQLPLVPFN